MHKYVCIGGRLYEFSKKTNYILGKAYAVDNLVYAYLGKTKKKLEMLRPGIYLDEKKAEYFVVEYLNGRGPTIKDIVIRSVEDKLREAIRGCQQTKDIGIKKRSSEQSGSGGTPLKYSHRDGDDEIVRMLKDAINSKGLHYQDVYDASLSNNSGYNLIYGLKNRSSITYESILKWAKILEMEIKIVLIPKKERK